MLQVFHNLTGRSANPWILTGEAMDEEQTLLATKVKHPIAYMFVLLYKHQLAVYMNNFSEAQRISVVIQQGDMGNVFPFLVASYEFMEGLVTARLSGSSKHHRTRAHRMLSKLKVYARHCPQNFQGKAVLVEAELCASTGDIEGALVTYKDAIQRANGQALVHEEALAYERAGYALRDCGRLEEAKEFFHQARSLYSSWGARSKVNQLSSLMIA
jgi:tetratricopeptide (TPR) repeat protein